MPSRFRDLALLMALVIALPACGMRQLAQGKIQPPEVSFRGLSLGRPTGQSWPVTVILLLTNPNRQALNLEGYDCELWLEGKSVAQAASTEPVYLPPEGQTRAKIPIVVKLPAVTSLLPVLLRPQQRLHYQVAGGFRLGAVLGGLVRVPFRSRGEVTPQEGLDLLQLYVH
jgi:LEA14-like dessication related protein